MQDSKRLRYIDMAKGLGILLVIVEHIGNDLSAKWVSAFAMPLFFFLSGYLFSCKRSFKDFVKRKCKTMLLPYFCLGIPLIVFDIFGDYVSHNFSVQLSFNHIVDFIIQRRVYTLWFLACLFVLELCFYYIAKKCSNMAILIISVICYGFGLAYYRFIGIELPWNIDICLIAVLYFAIGYVVKNNKNRIELILKSKSSYIALAITSVIVFIISTYNNIKFSGQTLSMPRAEFGIVPLSIISAFSGIFAVIMFSKFIRLKPIEYIGENSILYFAWHQTIGIAVTKLVLDRIMPCNTIWYYIIMFTVVVVMMTVFNIIITKTKLRFMVGK